MIAQTVVVKDIVIGVGGSPPLRLFFSGFEIVLHGRRDVLRHSLHQSCKSIRFRVGLNSGRSLSLNLDLTLCNIVVLSSRKESSKNVSSKSSNIR